MIFQPGRAIAYDGTGAYHDPTPQYAGGSSSYNQQHGLDAFLTYNQQTIARVDEVANIASATPGSSVRRPGGRPRRKRDAIFSCAHCEETFTTKHRLTSTLICNLCAPARECCSLTRALYGPQRTTTVTTGGSTRRGTGACAVARTTPRTRGICSGTRRPAAGRGTRRPRRLLAPDCTRALSAPNRLLP